MRRLLTQSKWVFAAGCAALFADCHDPNSPPPPPPPPIQSDLVVSGLQAAPATVSGLAIVAGGPGDSVFYVSMAVGTDSGSGPAIIRNLRTGQLVEVSVVDGGFTPVALSGVVGDSVSVSTGTLQRTMVVPDSRPPVVVRSEPPKKKADVPLNASLFVYFSEPIDGSSVTASSMRLVQGTTAVSGSTQFADSTHLTVEFDPAASLNPGTDYSLVVSSAIRGADGGALAAPDTIPFTTGSASTSPPASIQLNVSNLAIYGPTYQLTATVRDAAGDVLTGQPVLWSTVDTFAIKVSSTGLITALTAGGWYSVTADVPGCCGTGIDTLSVIGGPPASVVVTSATVNLPLGDTTTVQATIRDVAGHLLNYPSPTWSSSPPGLATVVSKGVGSYYGTATAIVTATAQGPTTINAISDSAIGSVSLTLGPARTAASVTVTPSAVLPIPGTSIQLTAAMLDSNARPLPAGAVPTWASSSPSVAAVDGTGLVSVLAAGVATITASRDGHSDSAVITVQSPQFASLSAGGSHSCGVTTAGTAYCWGENDYGELGVGGWLYHVSSPLGVSGITFGSGSVAAGDLHSCGLSNAGVAYCWGDDNGGELGDGKLTTDSFPDPVSGGLVFTVISPGAAHSCGVIAGGAAYCWGYNADGRLGDGTTQDHSIPTSVTRSLTFTTISAGFDHTCGLVAGGVAYCWGANDVGQLGRADSTGVSDSVPQAVFGGLTFTAISAGYEHTCALTAAGTVYCWGANGAGQLGDGTTFDRHSPVAVQSGQAFTAISAGGSHTCGIVSGGAVVCWGDDTWGQLGNGSTTGSTIPVAVSGSLSFASISVGGSHTCGLTIAGVAYCWGSNNGGQVGDGTGTDRSTPTKVSGQP